jgi:Ca-activated chloride channel homolog
MGPGISLATNHQGEEIMRRRTMVASGGLLLFVVACGRRETYAPRTDELRGARREKAVGQTVAPEPLAAVASAAPPEVMYNRGLSVETGATEEYGHTSENRFRPVSVAPLSTFSIDVDRAAYAVTRRYIMSGQLPPTDAVRIEELLNYFTYDDSLPSGDHPVAATLSAMAAPWAPTHTLARIALRSAPVDASELPPANLVFLIDVSGSMMAANKLPLVQSSLRLLAEQLRPQDHVALVTYAGSERLVLPRTSGANTAQILDAIDQLTAGGSTAGAAGIRLAYQVAREGVGRGVNSRVILASDGDFNVGVSDPTELERLIEHERASGVALSVLGYGMGNYKDNRLEVLADKGDGNYAYIDDMLEARKVLIEEFGGTMFTVAKDVKLQVEFNPAVVAGYRLIGYENRMLQTEDFADDAKDAGDLGAGHHVVALYELIPAGSPDAATLGHGSALRYAPEVRVAESPMRADELLTVNLRYKSPEGGPSRLLSWPMRSESRGASLTSNDLRFSAAVAAFAMTLRSSPRRGSSSLAMAESLASESLGHDANGHRRAFVDLVRMARGLAVASAGNATGEGTVAR